MRSASILILAGAMTLVYAPVWAQSISSGTILGTVTDPSGAMVAGAKAELTNAVSGYQRSAVTGSDGSFHFHNIPQNDYKISVTAPGFETYTQKLEIRTAVPINLAVPLKLATESTTVTVQASGAAVESDPSAHQDVDSSAMSKLPALDPGGQLSQVITYSTGAVVADANGFFHPMGDHGQTTFVIDGQPISDQQSKMFSTQIPTNAIQGMQLISGSPDAQYGDKSSLVVNATTRSGLCAPKTFGDIESQWGSFGTWGGNASLGFGNTKYGNFLAASGVRSGRFLDTPELLPIHDRGNNESLFDRFDWQPGTNDALHLNLFTARNWFQVPDSYDQLGQDQRQRVLTWSVAPGYQHVFNSHTLLTVNPFVRRDQLDYYPSADPFQDTPATASQQRFLTNYGIKADVAWTHGRHEIKVGTEAQQTRLSEAFQFGITDPSYDFTDAPGIIPYDLAHGGTLFQFHGRHNINQYAFYITDSMRLGRFTVNAGLRDDQYNGLSSANGVQPRLGISYLIPSTNTVLRVAYARTFETPFNEGLILSSGTGAGGLAGNVSGPEPTPIQPGRRNQFNAGFQQKIGQWIVADADYFWKYTRNGYDFAVLFNTPITFPIAWHNSKLDGVTARISTVDLHGFQAILTLGHTRARYFPPEVGGLVPLGGFANQVFRIDHDQAYQQNAVFRYQRPHAPEWISLSWRYDSGQVVSGVPDMAAALELTAAQQVAIGLACDGVPAAYSRAITACGGAVTSALLNLPQAGTANPDHNPARVAPRSVFNAGIGSDNLFHSEHGPKLTARFTVENLTNKPALYNFLSTFSGTHFVPPRTYQASVGLRF